MNWVKTVFGLIFKTIPSTLGGWITAIPTLIGLLKNAVDGIKWIVGKINASIRKKKVKEAISDAVEKKDTTKLDELLNG